MASRHLEISYESSSSDGLLPSDALPDLQLKDNAAIATHDIMAGDPIFLKGQQIAVSTHDILEGHRFAASAVPEGGELRSWGIVFGIALHPIAAGDYLCNVKVR